MVNKALLIISVIQLAVVLSCSQSDSKPQDQLANDSTITIPLPVPTWPVTRTDCENPESGWKIEKLNGKVKSLREDQIEYSFGSHKKELTRLVTFRPNGDYIKVDERWLYRVDDYRKIQKPTFVFDKDCRVLERQGPDREYGTTRTVYSYAPSGSVSQKAIYDSKGQLLWKSEGILDDNGYVIEENETVQVHPEHFNPKRYDVYRHTKSLYELDDVGNQVLETSYKYDGTLYATYKRAYDSSHRLIRVLRLDHKNRPVNLSVYKFDDAGLLQEELKYNSATYSAVDELIPGTLDSGYGMFQQGHRIAYEYDKTNNWIKKIEFDLAKGGKLDSVTSRTITYY